MNKFTRKQYIIEFQYRGKLGAPRKWETIARSSTTGKLMYSKEDVMEEIQRLKREDRRSRGSVYRVEKCGHLGISCSHCPEFDIVAYRVGVREVTPYEVIMEEHEEEAKLERGK